MKRYLALSLLAVSAFAQAPQPTRATQMAMQSLAMEVQQLQKDFAAVDAQVRKDCPGYHLDNGMNIVADAKPAAKPEVKEEPKK